MSVSLWTGGCEAVHCLGWYEPSAPTTVRTLYYPLLLYMNKIVRKGEKIPTSKRDLQKNTKSHITCADLFCNAGCLMGLLCRFPPRFLPLIFPAYFACLLVTDFSLVFFHISSIFFACFQDSCQNPESLLAGSLFEQKQHCDDGKLKSCVGQASNKFLDLDHPQTITNPQTHKPTNLYQCRLQEFRPAMEERKSDCFCNTSQKATSFSELAKERSAASHTDLSGQPHQPEVGRPALQVLACVNQSSYVSHPASFTDQGLRED